MRSRLSGPLSSLALLFAGCAAPPGRQDPFPALTELAVHGRQLNFGAGIRSFEDERLGRLDDPLVLALDYCEPMGLGALRLEGGAHYAYDEADGVSGGQDVRLKGQTIELSAGLSYSFLVGRLRPYVGAGLAFQFLTLRGIDEDSDTVFDDDDAAVGGYIKGGLLLQVSRISHVGIELRHLEGGEVMLDGTDLRTDYDQILLVFGTSFQ
jgi:hypothetical protein